MQVLVPIDWAQPSERFRDTSIDEGLDRGMDSSTTLAAYKDAKAAFVTAIAAKDGEIAGLRERAEQAEGRADRAERRSDRAEAALQCERARADALRDCLVETQAHQDRLRAEVDSAKAEQAQLRRADEEWKARGRWARLRLAWQGE
jgi:chromosome segregation ATPase